MSSWSISPQLLARGSGVADSEEADSEEAGSEEAFGGLTGSDLRMSYSCLYLGSCSTATEDFRCQYYNADKFPLSQELHKTSWIKTANMWEHMVGHQPGRRRNFRRGGGSIPKKAPHMEKKVEKRPPHDEKANDFPGGGGGATAYCGRPWPSVS